MEVSIYDAKNQLSKLHAGCGAQPIWREADLVIARFRNSEF